ncbi:alkylation response protein AidB-like acyl-CoA dehydrogenase [Leifsonia sp. 115AMFTsu3.1]|nr:alkylation response protein AidB-like acyl-CoA dehydrogenase [Leifsonia sp. 115AMFTsu3.1]
MRIHPVAVKGLVRMPASCDGVDMTTPTPTALAGYEEVAAESPGRVVPLLEALSRVPPDAVPLPGGGRTAERFGTLSQIAAIDLTAARVLEPHLDALAILAEAGLPHPATGTTWGVFAAEAPGTVLEAVRSADGWTLDGVKPWCSLGGRLTHGLVTASVADERRMFAVDLRQDAVTAEPAAWVARGLAEVESGPLRFEKAAAEPVGAAGWYLDRPGFRWGGIGVAACWWGGCLPLFRALTKRAAAPGNPLLAARVGELYRALESGRIQLEHAAGLIDAGAGGDDAAALAHTVRGTVADAVVLTLAAVRDLLGPAALAFDEAHARRAADLELYVSQYHRGRDDESLAKRLAQLDARSVWW